MGRHVDFHNAGWEATSRAMEATVHSDRALPIFGKAIERFQEVTCSGLLNWGNVHTCIAHKYMEEAALAGGWPGGPGPGLGTFGGGVGEEGVAWRLPLQPAGPLPGESHACELLLVQGTARGGRLPRRRQRAMRTQQPATTNQQIATSNQPSTPFTALHRRQAPLRGGGPGGG
jgi:hypothetical protein